MSFLKKFKNLAGGKDKNTDGKAKDKDAKEKKPDTTKNDGTEKGAAPKPIRAETDGKPLATKKAAGNGRRLIVLGLDGTPFTLIQRMFAEGKLPNLSSLVQEGDFKQMKSVIPTISSVAWSSFMTGCNPAKHNIFGFVDLKPNSYDFTIPVASDMKAKPLWERLGGHGLRSIVINVPETYPPKKIYGQMVSGFLCTDVKKVAQPPELSEKLEKMGYRIDIDAWQARKDKDRMLEDIDYAFTHRVKAMFSLMDNEKWDYFHCHIMCTDRLHHFLWEQMENGHPVYEPAFMAFYMKVDDMLGVLRKRLDDRTDLIILSDHGFCTVKREVELNHWLQQQGYLKLGEEFRKPDGGPVKLSEMSSESKAFSLIPGRIFINLKGKFPKGSVDKADYEKLRTEITEKLFTMTDSMTGESIIESVHRKEDIYNGPLMDRAADLIAMPYYGFDLKAKLDATELCHGSEICGMHTYDDAFLYVRKKKIIKPDLEFEITDVMPTAMKIMGLPIPDGLDGKPVVD